MFRAPQSFMMQTQGFLMLWLWRTTGLMLLGMALMRSGFLAGQLAPSVYWRAMLPGFLIGLPPIAWGIARNEQMGWTFEYSQFFGMLPNHFGSVLLSLAYVSLLIVMCQKDLGGWILRGFSRIGQMALSCYLLQTLICTSLFYGHGLGWFGDAERVQQAQVIFAVWVFLFVFTAVWQRYFVVGPFEWLWRSLTYGKRQPLVKPAT